MFQWKVQARLNHKRRKKGGGEWRTQINKITERKTRKVDINIA